MLLICIEHVPLGIRYTAKNVLIQSKRIRL